MARPATAALHRSAGRRRRPAHRCRPRGVARVGSAGRWPVTTPPGRRWTSEAGRRTWSPDRASRYVPAAALVLRGGAFGDNPRVFDEDLRYGEDVDLVWRLIAAGWTVRYEPTAAVGHAHRATIGAALAQRFGYGFSAASLAARHPGKLAPFAGARLTVAAWGLLAAGRFVPAAGILAAETIRVARTLPVRRPILLAARLVIGGSPAFGRMISEALTPPLRARRASVAVGAWAMAVHPAADRPGRPRLAGDVRVRA